MDIILKKKKEGRKKRKKEDLPGMKSKFLTLDSPFSVKASRGRGRKAVLRVDARF